MVGGLEIALLDTVIPQPHNRYKSYNGSEKGKSRKNGYRARVSDAQYLAKPFRAWDGEGGNEDDGRHTYFLLASSDDHVLRNRAGLSTISVFDLWLNTSGNNVTNIIYGGGYDFNKIVKDLSHYSLKEIYETGSTRWQGYRIDWRFGKSFRVAKGDRSFLIYDVLPFFQRPFVQACDEYLGTDWPYRDQIIREKKRRGTFDWTEIENVAEYNRAELQNLVSLAEELRTRLHRVDIRVKRWDGPGAIATSLYQKYETKLAYGSIPDEVSTAAQHGYAGGRFEIIRQGHSEYPAYQYDIRSAYPSAIRHLPCLAHGWWRHRTDAVLDSVAKFGIYRVQIFEPHTQSVTQPQPLWMRDKDGRIYYSDYVHGWYWSPEVELVLGKRGVGVWEGWEYVQECDHEPFSFVEALYNKRAALKKAGDGAHVGLKLGLNSLYGKLAQQIGWDPGPPLRIPPYHSLEWAGWITSHCRAQIYRAALLAPDDVIAFETDAIFSRVPLSLQVGSRLGEWEESKYSSLTYLQSGMYYGTTDDGKEVEKSRGINKGTVTRSDAISALHALYSGKGSYVLDAEQTRFVTLGQALNQDFSKWGNWYTTPRRLSMMLNGKRVNLLDGRMARKEVGDGWRETMPGQPDVSFSTPYEVAWKEPKWDIPDSIGRNLDDVRQQQSEGGYE